jgi:hypothetical protein
MNDDGSALENLRRHHYGVEGVIHAPIEQVRAALAAEYERGMQEGLDLRDELREENARLRAESAALQRKIEGSD